MCIFKNFFKKNKGCDDYFDRYIEKIQGKEISWSISTTDKYTFTILKYYDFTNS
jgi:hypothetical protein